MSDPTTATPELAMRVLKSVPFAGLVVADGWSLERHGGNVGNVWVGQCPFCHAPGAFSLDSSRGLYYCFNCRGGGDTFHYYMMTRGVTFAEAISALAEMYSLADPVQ